jgi:hypothetical protein
MKNILIAVLLIIISTCSVAYSQVTLQAGGGLGVVMPTSDFGGTTVDYYYGKKYGLSTGYNIYGKVRVGLLGFTVVGELGYSSLANSGNSEPGQGKVEVSQSIISVKAGPEFHFDVPSLPVIPYFGGNIAINRFSGETMFQGVSKITTATYSVKSATRLGIGLGGGIIVKLGPLMNLDVSLQYNMMNIGGRSWDDQNPFEDKRIDSYLTLNDDKDPLYGTDDSKHIVSKSRSIHTFGLAASIMFGL